MPPNGLVQSDARAKSSNGFAELPKMVSTPTGPKSQAIAATLRAYEAPHINTASGSTPVVWDSAKGATVTDVEGNRYLDLTASFGAAAIGHNHDDVVAAIKKQAGQLLVALGDLHPHPPRAELAERLARFLPIDNAMVYFAMTGAEAVEIAIKTAVMKTGKSDILVFDPSYHGCTLAALSASSRESFRAPFSKHLSRCMQRLPFGCDNAEIANVLQSQSFAAVLVEPIVGREGVLFPPAGWLKALQDVCHANGVLLIVDEILTGFGRTGSWFAFQREGVTPDIICCGKALGGGVPIAVVAARSDIMMAWEAPGTCIHTTTFLANALGCAAATATLEVMERENLPARAEHLGEMLRCFFDDLQRDLGPKLSSKGAAIIDANGRGLLWRVETSPPSLARKWAEFALSNGLLVLASGGIMRISPPILISEQQLRCATEILRVSLDMALDDLELTAC